MLVDIGANYRLTTSYRKSQGYLSAVGASGLKDSSQRGFIKAWVQMLAPVTSATPSSIFSVVLKTEDQQTTGDRFVQAAKSIMREYVRNDDEGKSSVI